MTRSWKTNNSKSNTLKSRPLYIILIILMMLVGMGFLVMLALVDAFPRNMVVSFVAVLVVMVLLALLLFSRKNKWLRVTGILVVVLFVGIYGLGIYYLSTTYTMFSRITETDQATAVEANGVNVTEDSFNVYITGIDQWNSEKGLDLERSDVNMIVTVCPKTRKILLTSIPRDTYVPLHRNGAMDKLTHTGIYGVDETLNTMSDWLGIDMNYYLKANFSAFRDVVNAMGGIDVDNPVAFKSSNSRYKYRKGMIHMKGKRALFYARERKAFNGEDSRRVENQQRVVKAILDKMLSSSTLLTKYGDVLEAAGEGMSTNMSAEEMQALVKMQLADLRTWDVESQKLEGKYKMDYVASLTQESKFLVYKADKKSYKSIRENIDAVMNPSASEIAEATATRQKNSIMSFLRSLKGDDETKNK